MQKREERCSINYLPNLQYIETVPIWIMDWKIDDALEKKAILFHIQRKSNSKKINTVQQKFEKLKMRKKEETTINNIKKLFPKTINAINMGGFLIMLTLYVFRLQLSKAIN